MVPGKQVPQWGGGDTMIPGKQVQQWGGGDTMIPGKQVQQWGGGDTVTPGKDAYIQQWLKNQPNSWPLGPEPDQSQPKSKTQDPLGLKFLRICQRLNRRYGPCQARLKTPFNWGLLDLEIFILCRRSLTSRQARLHQFNRGLHRPPRLKRLLGGPLSSIPLASIASIGILCRYRRGGITRPISARRNRSRSPSPRAFSASWPATPRMFSASWSAIPRGFSPNCLATSDSVQVRVPLPAPLPIPRMRPRGSCRVRSILERTSSPLS